jgi:enterochelin esterase-like enzyme
VRGRLRFAVYLPPGYADGNRRYPVVYFLHGLPASEAAHRDITYVGRALETASLPAIVVGVQGARAGDTDPEYLDWGPGRNWETAVATELPRVVDGRYRTIAARGGRAVIGTSAGGYGAAVIGLHHLDTYSVIESWSGYFHPTDPSGAHPLPRGSQLEDMLASAHSFVPSLRAAFARQPTFLGFYVGSGDATFLKENVELARELSRAKVPFLFEIYPGGHSRSLWEAQAGRWLGLAVGHLAPAT